MYNFSKTTMRTDMKKLAEIAGKEDSEFTEEDNRELVRITNKYKLDKKDAKGN